MKKHLCIGIQHKTDEWESVLNQIGVWFQEVDYSMDLSQNYSVVILNEKPDKAQITALNNYLENGGGVLEIQNNIVFNSPSQIDQVSARTLFNNSRDEYFEHIPFIDLFAKAGVHKQSKIFSGLIHIHPFKNGVLGFMGTDVSTLVHKNGYTRKNFYSRHGNNPNEIVSKVSKHELIQVFLTTLKEMHFRQHLPFVQKWAFPEKKPVFCFRIDSDFGDRESIDKLYQTLEKHKISGTWFLHVAAHEAWINHFKALKGQEIALHGYQHGSSTSVEKTTENIDKGLSILRENDYNVKGYCAPYGIWNNALKDSLKAFQFTYTSEFTFKYDGFPSQSSNSEEPIQIPVHPICTGSLKRQKYTSDTMKSYFEDIINAKLARFEPVIFYHHPLQPGLDVMDFIFRYIKQKDLENLTFNDYASFWKERRISSFKVAYIHNHLEFTEIDDACKYLQISTNHTQFDVVKPTESTFKLQKQSEFEYAKPYFPPSNDIQELRTKNLKLIKASLIDWRNRIRL